MSSMMVSMAIILDMARFDASALNLIMLNHYAKRVCECAAYANNCVI